jgi:acyl-CoA synthetase (AMP-forming)/AMP-acid ligase II
MEAAKRVGLAYVAVAAGTVAAVLADRLRDTLGAVLVTRAELLEAVQAALELLEPSARPTVVLAPSSVRNGPSATELLFNGPGQAGACASTTDVAASASRCASQLLERAMKRLHLGWSAVQKFPPQPPQPLQGLKAHLPLSAPQLIAAAWGLVRPSAVEASHPLFILYTSGSTGKPKGIVHVHGGHQAS